MSKWKLLDLTVIYIPVYTVVQLPIQSIFWQKMIASLRRKQSYHSWFYDNVELSLEERAEMAKAFTLEKYKKALDLKDVYGEKAMKRSDGVN
jgi:hypothetical protein